MSDHVGNENVSFLMTLLKIWRDWGTVVYIHEPCFLISVLNHLVVGTRENHINEAALACTHNLCVAEICNDFNLKRTNW